MKAGRVALVLVLFSAAAAWPQDGQEPQDQQPSPQDQQQQQRRPTLGPAPAPTLRSPRSANIVDARRLVRVQKIYVERMDNSLGEKLVEGLTKSRRWRIVADRHDADAVLRGTCFDSRRLKSVHSEVYLSDVRGAPIWQDSLHRPYNPPPLAAAVSQTADLIVADLLESILEAERK